MTFNSRSRCSSSEVNFVLYNCMLSGVHAASPPVTWSILPNGVPSPASGAVIIYASHITTLRTYMDGALNAVGIAPWAFTDSGLGGSLLMRALHVTDLQERAK